MFHWCFASFSAKQWPMPQARVVAVVLDQIATLNDHEVKIRNKLDIVEIKYLQLFPKRIENSQMHLSNINYLHVASERVLGTFRCFTCFIILYEIVRNRRVLSHQRPRIYKLREGHYTDGEYKDRMRSSKRMTLSRYSPVEGSVK